MTEKTATVSKPLFATVGAGDAIYAVVNDVVADVRGRVVATDAKARVEGARERFANVPADVQAQLDTLRERISGLPSELPEDLAELREKFTPEELRRLAEHYYRQALDIYADLAVRGEETVDRLRTNQSVDERIGRVETLYKDASARAEDALVKVNDLLGRGKAEAEAVADKVEAVVEAEVVAVTDETVPAKAPAARKAPAKKAAPAKKPAAPKTI
ncbi:heparin-binding hemagglutinin [Nocardia sp. A7]|uniref:heparin-binding hemagglutinin n=1 Tax=Nocardia sp. A7 TaxID=2789274 RepID=UPI0039797224